MVKKEYRDRTAVIYCHSNEQRQRLYDFAESKGSTFSKYALNLLEEAMAKADSDLPKQDMVAFQRDLQDMRKGYRELGEKLASQAQELLRLRSNQFLTPSGTAEVSKELLDILRDNPGIHSHAILDKLGANSNDARLVTGISRQLEMLEVSGFAQKTKGGWKLIDE